VGLAIAYRIRRDGETPDEMFTTAKRWAERFGEEAPETEEDSVETHALLAYRLASTLLALAGIPEEACSVGALWKANGWTDGYDCREPTAAERRADSLSSKQVARNVP
jgi:hypothetical protein